MDSINGAIDGDMMVPSTIVITDLSFISKSEETDFPSDTDGDVEYPDLDVNEINPDIVKAEMSFYSTPHTEDYRPVVYKTLKNIEKTCAADFTTLCAPSNSIAGAYGMTSDEAVAMMALPDFLTKMGIDVMMVQNDMDQPSLLDNVHSFLLAPVESTRRALSAAPDTKHMTHGGSHLMTYGKPINAPQVVKTQVIDETKFLRGVPELMVRPRQLGSGVNPVPVLVKDPETKEQPVKELGSGVNPIPVLVNSEEKARPQGTAPVHGEPIIKPVSPGDLVPDKKMRGEMRGEGGPHGPPSPGRGEMRGQGGKGPGPAGPFRGPGGKGPEGMGPGVRTSGPEGRFPGPGPQGMGPGGRISGPEGRGPGPQGEGRGPGAQGMGPGGRIPGPEGRGPGPQGEGRGPGPQGMRPEGRGPGPQGMRPGENGPPRPEGRGSGPQGMGPEGNGPPRPEGRGPGPEGRGPGPQGMGSGGNGPPRPEGRPQSEGRPQGLARFNPFNMFSRGNLDESDSEDEEGRPHDHHNHDHEDHPEHDHDHHDHHDHFGPHDGPPHGGPPRPEEGPPPVQSGDEDTYFTGSLGFGTTGDMCVYQNFETLTYDCQSAIADLHQMRDSFWREDVDTVHNGDWHHRGHGNGGFLMGLLLATVISVFGRLYRRRFGKRKQVRAVLTAIEGNPSLKAQVEAEAGMPLPQLQMAPPPASWAMHLLAIVMCFFGAIFVTGFNIILTSIILAGLSHVDESTGEVMTPPPSCALGILGMIITVELVGFALVTRALRQRAAAIRASGPSGPSAPSMATAVLYRPPSQSQGPSGGDNMESKNSISTTTTTSTTTSQSSTPGMLASVRNTLSGLSNPCTSNTVADGAYSSLPSESTHGEQHMAIVTGVPVSTPVTAQQQGSNTNWI